LEVIAVAAAEPCWCVARATCCHVHT